MRIKSTLELILPGKTDAEKCLLCNGQHWRNSGTVTGDCGEMDSNGQKAMDILVNSPVV